MNSPAASPKSPAAKPRSSARVIPNEPRWYQRLGARIIWAVLRTLAATLRYEWDDRSGYRNETAAAPVIFCVWHNRLALSMKAYFGYGRKRTRSAGMAAIVSASRDGAFLAAILKCFKVQPVRGSSSRRGPQALLELLTWAERGYDLAITPDGPRGPCYVVQEGVMSLAQLSGLPILPFSFELQWKVRPKSWDRFQIPLPFSRCKMILEKPIRVPREASDAEREELRRQLEKTLKDISRD